MSKWEMVRLNKICDLQNGYAFKSNDYVEYSNTLNCRMSNIRPNGSFDILYNPKYLPDEYFQKYENFRLIDGDVIIAMTDMANEPKILGIPTIVKTQGYNCLLNQRVGKLIINNKIISPEYLSYVLNRSSVKRYYQKYSSGGLQINLGKKDLLSIEIPLPPLAIQQQIASTLDTAAALLALRKQQLAELDALIQSVFVEMFGDLAINPMLWKVKKLIELCVKKDDIKCGPFGTQLSKEEYQNKGVPIWGIPQINKMFKIDPTDYLTEEKAKQLEPYSIIADDIIMSRKGNVGKCAIYPNSFEMGIMHSDALRIRVDKSRVNPFFLMYQLHYSRYVLNQIGIVSSGAIMAGINVTKLKNINIHVPPLSLQNQFAAIVEKIEQQKGLVQQAIDETQTLFDSLMAEYFE